MSIMAPSQDSDDARVDAGVVSRFPKDNGRDAMNPPTHHVSTCFTATPGPHVNPTHFRPTSTFTSALSPSFYSPPLRGLAISLCSADHSHTTAAFRDCVDLLHCLQDPLLRKRSDNAARCLSPPLVLHVQIDVHYLGRLGRRLCSTSSRWLCQW
jgi:hypothetical protein